MATARLTLRYAFPIVDWLVPATDNDRYLDYCLQPYRPRRSSKGKLRGESLLWHSFATTNAPPILRDAVSAIQSTAGRDATVFGVKQDASGRVFWELYFYDPQKEDARVTATAIAKTVAPHLRLTPRVRESIPYFMFSFDLSHEIAERRAVESLNLYLAEPIGQAGRSYRLEGGQLDLENFYTFLRPKEDVDEIVTRIKSSAVIDYTRVSLGRVLLPELFSCARICVAKKRRSDAVYYSGIHVDQLIWFLERFHYPTALAAFVRSERARLDHLLFDVGIDFTVDRDGNLLSPKTSYYSTV